jgi:hypothetical protein
MPKEVRRAIEVWNYLGGTVPLTDDLLVAMELVGEDDPEQMIRDLMTIRDAQRNS